MILHQRSRPEHAEEVAHQAGVRIAKRLRAAVIAYGQDGVYEPASAKELGHAIRIPGRGRLGDRNFLADSIEAAVVEGLLGAESEPGRLVLAEVSEIEVSR